MINLTKNSLEALIISKLQNRSLPIVALIEEIKEERPKTSKQAVYAVIRKLKEQEVVVVYSKQVSLSKIWIEEMLNFFTVAHQEYIGDKNIMDMSEGDKISYIFNNPFHADRFWAHLWSVMSSANDSRVPIMLYNPHEWFFVVRGESEREVFRKTGEEGNLILLTSGNGDPIDKLVLGREFGDSKHEYTINEKTGFKINYYLNIFGDFIVEASIDPKTALEMDDFYKNHTELSAENIEKLRRIVSKQGKTKLTITRNPERAHKLRKQLAKEFLIAKEYKI